MMLWEWREKALQEDTAQLSRSVYEIYGQFLGPVTEQRRVKVEASGPGIHTSTECRCNPDSLSPNSL